MSNNGDVHIAKSIPLVFLVTGVSFSNSPNLDQEICLVNLTPKPLKFVTYKYLPDSKNVVCQFTHTNAFLFCHKITHTKQKK